MKKVPVTVSDAPAVVVIEMKVDLSSPVGAKVGVDTDAVVEAETISSLEATPENKPPRSLVAVSIAWIGLFGQGGVLLRYWLTEMSKWMSEWHSDSVTGALGHSHLLPNIVGCFIMGFLVAAQTAWGHNFPNLWAGLGVGFCGCLTTFSSWNQAASANLANGDVLDWALVLFLGYASSHLAYDIGTHLGALADPLFFSRAHPLTTAMKQAYRFSAVVPWFVWGAVIFAMSTLHLGYLLAAVFHSARRDMWLSLATCFLGSFLRYTLFVTRPKWTPTVTATLAANVLGSVCLSLLVVFTLLWEGDLNKAETSWGRDTISGSSVGILGSLATVSTFVKEVHNLPSKRYQYMYGVGSVAVVQALQLCINGPYVWTR